MKDNSYQLNTEISTYEDLVLPETLYKYRDWNTPIQREIISKKEVYFAPPSSFVDPFDCKIPTRWDLLSHNEILNKYYTISIETNPDFLTHAQHIEFAVHWANNTAINHPEFVKVHHQKQFSDHSVRTGVLCLTEFDNSMDMWERYSMKHTGFCIGFNPAIMLKGIGGGGGKVLYNSELPIIYPAPKHSYSLQANLQVFSKLTDWEFEQEYRTYIFRPKPLNTSDRIFKVPEEGYKELIFGARTPNSTIKKIIESIPEGLNHMMIKRAYIDNGEIIIRPFETA